MNSREGKFVYRFAITNNHGWAEVQNMQNMQTVWNYTLTTDEQRANSPVASGAMKDWNDVAGLEKYLKGQGVIPENGELMSDRKALVQYSYFENGGEIGKGVKVDKIEEKHPLILMQDAIEFVESNTDFIVNDAPNEEKLKGKKYHLMRSKGDTQYEDVGYMTESEILEFAKEKGFGKFQNIDLDDLLNTTASKCKRLECDGTVRVLHYILDSHEIPHYVFVGTLEINSKIMNPHFWIGLPDGRYVDYKAQIWFGNDAPNGIFYPKDTNAIYTGTPIELKVSATTYKLLLHTV